MVASNEALSFGAYARARRCTRQAVSRQVATGRLDSALVRKGRATLIVPAVADELWPRRDSGREPAADPRPRRSKASGSGAVSRAEADRRRAVAAAEKAELELRRLRGEVVDAGEVRRIGFTRAREAQKALLAIPARLPLSYQHRELLRAEILRVCEQLADATAPGRGRPGGGRTDGQG